MKSTAGRSMAVRLLLLLLGLLLLLLIFIEKNIFENIFKNTAFVSVLLFTMVVQFLFVEFGGEFAG
jgi:hypothetical protein